jgi:hypothetical protein
VSEKKSRRTNGAGTIDIVRDPRHYVQLRGRIRWQGRKYFTKGVGLGANPTPEQMEQARAIIETRLTELRASLGASEAVTLRGMEVAAPTRAVDRRPLALRVRWAVLQRCDFTCQYCGRRAPDVVLHVDHIIPVARGGTDEQGNLTAACSDCNHGKKADLLGADR